MKKKKGGGGTPNSWECHTVTMAKQGGEKKKKEGKYPYFPISVFLLIGFHYRKGKGALEIMELHGMI